MISRARALTGAGGMCLFAESLYRPSLGDELQRAVTEGQVHLHHTAGELFVLSAGGKKKTTQ